MDDTILGYYGQYASLDMLRFISGIFILTMIWKPFTDDDIDESLTRYHYVMTSWSRAYLFLAFSRRILQAVLS